MHVKCLIAPASVAAYYDMLCCQLHAIYHSYSLRLYVGPGSLCSATADSRTRLPVPKITSQHFYNKAMNDHKHIREWGLWYIGTHGIKIGYTGT